MDAFTLFCFSREDSSYSREQTSLNRECVDLPAIRLVSRSDIQDCEQNRSESETQYKSIASLSSKIINQQQQPEPIRQQDEMYASEREEIDVPQRGTESKAKKQAPEIKTEREIIEEEEDSQQLEEDVFYTDSSGSPYVESGNKSYSDSRISSSKARIESSSQAELDSDISFHSLYEELSNSRSYVESTGKFCPESSNYSENEESIYGQKKRERKQLTQLTSQKIQRRAKNKFSNTTELPSLCTKNLMKNYSQAICTWILSPIGTTYYKTVSLQDENSNDFRNFVDSNRYSISTVHSMRSLLVNSEGEEEDSRVAEFKRVFRELALIFIDNFACNWIFCSKMSAKNKISSLLLRFAMRRRFANPVKFTSMKNYD